jgi:hypothetical protein
MSKYAENTEVPAARSREEIEKTLMRFGATKFMYGWEDTRAIIAFVAHGKQVRFVLPMPDRNSPEITRTPGKGLIRSVELQEKAYEQAVRQKWRALAAAILAKFAAVEAGISVFEREFFYDTVLPNGQTVGEYLLPQVEESYRNGNIPSILPALERGRGEVKK